MIEQKPCKQDRWKRKRDGQVVHVLSANNTDVQYTVTGLRAVRIRTPYFMKTFEFWDRNGSMEVKSA